MEIIHYESEAEYVESTIEAKKFGGEDSGQKRQKIKSVVSIDKLREENNPKRSIDNDTAEPSGFRNKGGSKYEAADSKMIDSQNSNEGMEKLETVSCIFKVFDDIRQDCLALQVIRLFQEVFRKVDLDLYLFPYRTIPNRTGKVKKI